MISEGSCDTEPWSKDAENSALITGINYTFKLHFSYVQLHEHKKVKIYRKLEDINKNL